MTRLTRSGPKITPQRAVAKTPGDVEPLVGEIRPRLLTTQDAPRGALAIPWQLRPVGVAPLPALWTINRLRKRRGVVGQPTPHPRGTPSPALAALRPHSVHQLALVGPRDLKGGERFDGIQRIDAHSHAVALAAGPSKRAVEVAEALVVGWQELGLPRYLQLDNELSCRGANRHPRSFGLLIRLGLDLGVEVCFIPESEPWRNGLVARFNDVDDKLFFRAQSVRDRTHLCEELPRVETFHTTQHRYAKLGGRTPWEAHTAIKRRRLSRQCIQPRQGVPWREGRVTFIRLPDDPGRVRCFSETFLVDPPLAQEYVQGTIFTKAGLLKFRQHNRTIQVYPYGIPRPPHGCSRCPATFDALQTVSDVLLHDNYCLNALPL